MNLRNCLEIFLLAASLLYGVAGAAEPVAPIRHIPMNVPPYYVTAANPADRPQVNVSRGIDTLLASSDPVDILKVRDMVSVTPARFTPIAFTVLAFRMYEVGLRDDAMFWYFVGRYHYRTMQGVLDLSAPTLVQLRNAMSIFITRGGEQIIEGYALCNPVFRIKQLNAALDLVAAKPYSLLYMENIAALPGDRRENIKSTLNQLKEELLAKEKLTEDKSVLTDLARERHENGDDVRYCWK